METKSIAPPLFTTTSAGSLGAVAATGLFAYIGAKAFLPKNVKWQDHFTFVWLVSPVSSMRIWDASFELVPLLLGFRRINPLHNRGFFLVPVDLWSAGKYEYRTIR